MSGKNPGDAIPKNQIVDYWSGERLKIGLVAGPAAPGQLNVLDGGGRGERIAVAAVAARHGGTLPDAEGRRALGILAGRLRELAKDVDLEKLWRHAAASPARDWLLAELALAARGDTEPESLGAVARALAADRAYFAGARGIYRPQPAAAVRSALETAAARDAAAARRDACRAWLRGPAASLAQPAPELQGLVGELREYVLKDSAPELAALLAGLPPETVPPRLKAVQILENLRLLPPGCDLFVLRSGIPPELPAAAETAAAALEPFAGDPSRRDFGNLEAFTIDDDDTLEVDDALSVETCAEGLQVGIHIADPGCFTKPGDSVDAAAAARATSVYLPTGNLTMLPRRLGCGLASLQAGEWRPCLSFLAVFNAAGELLRQRLERGCIRVGQRLNYEQADALIATDSQAAPGPALRALFRLAERLQRTRHAAGAQTAMRPQFKILVRDGVLSVKRTDRNAPSQILVSEMMVLANRLAADFAAARGLPFVYRNQEAAEQMPFEPAEAGAPAPGQNLRRPQFSVAAAAHAGLGLQRYCQTTSPLRRFTDLINIRQLNAALARTPLPYGTAQIRAILEALEPRTAAVRNLEYEVNRYWLLKHLQAAPADAVYAARVVRFLKDGRGIAELEEFGLRGWLDKALAAGLQTGAGLQVRIAGIDPDTADLALAV